MGLHHCLGDSCCLGCSPPPSLHFGADSAQDIRLDVVAQGDAPRGFVGLLAETEALVCGVAATQTGVFVDFDTVATALQGLDSG